jgi:Flp pilus assembly protein protease CpaA
MSIALLRDVVIIILSILGTIFLIALMVIMFFLYRRVSVIQNKIKDPVSKISRLISQSLELLRGITPILGFLGAIIAGINLVRKTIETKKGGKTSEERTME